MLAEIREGGEAAARRFARDARPMGRRHRRRPRGASCRGRGGARAAEGGHPVRAREHPPLRRGAAGDHLRLRGRDPAGVAGGPAADPRLGGGLLRAGRALQPCGIRDHDDHDGQGSGRAACRGLFAAATRRRHSAGHRLHHGPVRCRHDLEPRRRAGGRGDGRWAVRSAAGRHSGRPGQPVRRRGQAHPLRAGRHRHVRRARPTAW